MNRRKLIALLFIPLTFITGAKVWLFGGRISLHSYIPSIFSVKLTKGGALVSRGKLWVEPTARIEIHGGQLLLGHNIFLNRGVLICSMGSIRIGKNCLIGPGVKIYDHNHCLDPSKRSQFEVSNVVIGDNVWIGCNAVILPGVSIGDGSVIAAGAVVSKNIPSNVVAAGVPAVNINNII